MSGGPSFVHVARLSDIAEGKGIRVRLGDDEIALWRVRWTYSLETGIALSGSGRVGRHNVMVEGDDVYIELPVRGE